jgi:hypothetical protein
MVDPWRSWDDRLKARGQPRRVCEDLTDAELLNLLACERNGRRGLEKDLIKQELFDRLQAQRGPGH